MSKILERVAGTVDERLPFHQFMDESRKQAEAMPLEIVEEGIAYEAFDCKMHIEGHRSIMTARYRVKSEGMNNT